GARARGRPARRPPGRGPANVRENATQPDLQEERNRRCCIIPFSEGRREVETGAESDRRFLPLLVVSRSPAGRRARNDKQESKRVPRFLLACRSPSGYISGHCNSWAPTVLPSSKGASLEAFSSP